MPRLLAIALLFLSFGMLGCKSVQPSDLTGIWTINDVSRQVLPADLRKTSAKLLLHADGTFVASDLPEELPPEMTHRVRLDTGSGVWKLVSREGKQQVQLDFHALAGSREADVPYGMQMDVSKRWSSVGLYYFLGDADEGRRLSFERK